MPYAEKGAAPLMEVLAAELADQRSRKATIESRAAATATTAATLAAAVLALAGLLYSVSSFHYNPARVIALGAMLLLFSVSLIFSLIALAIGGYPNIPVVELRQLKQDHWDSEAIDSAAAIFDKYANFLATYGQKNETRVSRLRVGIGFQIAGICATLLGAFLFATNHI